MRDVESLRGTALEADLGDILLAECADLLSNERPTPVIYPSELPSRPAIEINNAVHLTVDRDGRIERASGGYDFRDEPGPRPAAIHAAWCAGTRRPSSQTVP